MVFMGLGLLLTDVENLPGFYLKCANVQRCWALKHQGLVQGRHFLGSFGEDVAEHLVADQAIQLGWIAG